METTPLISSGTRPAGVWNAATSRARPVVRNIAPATRVTVTAAASVCRRNTRPSTVISPPPSAPSQNPSLPILNSVAARVTTPPAKSSQPRNSSETLVAMSV